MNRVNIHHFFTVALLAMCACFGLAMVMKLAFSMAAIGFLLVTLYGLSGLYCNTRAATGVLADAMKWGMGMKFLRTAVLAAALVVSASMSVHAVSFVLCSLAAWIFYFIYDFIVLFNLMPGTSRKCPFISESN